MIQAPYFTCFLTESLQPAPRERLLSLLEYEDSQEARKWWGWVMAPSIIQNLKAMGSFPVSTTGKLYSLHQLLPPPQCLMLPPSVPVTGLSPSLSNLLWHKPYDRTQDCVALVLRTHQRLGNNQMTILKLQTVDSFC